MFAYEKNPIWGSVWVIFYFEGFHFGTHYVIGSGFHQDIIECKILSGFRITCFKGGSQFM